MDRGKHHRLSRDDRNVHDRWNRNLPPALRVRSGDTVTMETRDSNDGQLTPGSTARDVAARDTSRIHTITGPVYVEEAEPGDVLQVDFLKYEVGEWGWSVIMRGRGFLPGEFPDDYFQAWRFDEKREYAELKSGVRVKLEPFCGIAGVAWDEPGEFRTQPPRKSGGNMDIKYLTAGTRLYLPVFVRGALFSAGDGHAAQGDGEICVTAIETELTVTVRLTVRKDFSIEEPQYETGEYYATTGIGSTIDEAAQKAARFMVTRLKERYALSPEEAYVLCSAAMDMKICEVVNAPHHLVSAHLPKSVLGAEETL